MRLIDVKISEKLKMRLMHVIFRLKTMIAHDQ